MENSSKKEKIIIVCPSLGIGGREKIAINTAKCLSEEYDVIMAVFSRLTNEYSCDCQLINLNLQANSNRFVKAIASIFRVIKLTILRLKYRPVVSFSLSTAANFVNVLSGVLGCGKSIISLHGFGNYRDFENRIAINNASKVICISQEMKDDLQKQFPINKKFVVIENGYEIDKVIEMSKSQTVALEGEHNFVALGRLEEVKNYSRLLYAFAKYRKNHNRDYLYIIGDGSEKEKLVITTKKLGIEDSVIFLGHMSNPFYYMRAADVFVLSSNNEGFPNALIEALACSLPSVCVDCQSGPREILSAEYSSKRVTGVKFEKYGVLVENTDNCERFSDLFSIAMDRLVANPKMMAEYKRNSIERARDFSLERYEKRVRDLFSI